MSQARHTGLLSAFLFFLVLLACGKTEDRAFFVDRAGMLDQKARQRIVEYNRALLKDFNIHCRVVILGQRSMDINSEAADLFGDLGEKTGKARGLLLLIDPVGEQVRVEVGYDLEEIFPDIFVSYLEHEQMLPFFQQGKVGAGIEATEELFVARVQRSLAGNSFDPGVEIGGLSHYSGGGGARTKIVIGEESMDKAAAVDSTAYQPQKSPERSLTLYMAVLRHKIKDPDLALYTPGTRKFLSRWVVTDAQQDNELSRLEGAVIDKVTIAGNRAVIRFPVGERALPPYFLENNGDGWAIDFATMSEFIRMNHKNMWHFVCRDHPYMFGFVDWRFDSNGYPMLTR